MTCSGRRARPRSPTKPRRAVVEPTETALVDEAAATPDAEPAPAPAPRDAAADVRSTTWARVQLARNLRRPRILDLVGAMADEFIELHGDRLFGDDQAV